MADEIVLYTHPRSRGRIVRWRAPYLVADRFTAADLYVGSHLGFGRQFGTTPKRPGFERYWSRLNARAAKQRADRLDDALIAA